MPSIKKWESLMEKVMEDFEKAYDSGDPTEIKKCEAGLSFLKTWKSLNSKGKKSSKSTKEAPVRPQ